MAQETLVTGAEMRTTGTGERAVVCVNGGGRAAVPGTWSASLEWLVRRLAPSFPGLHFVEVRYRVKSWRRLDLCIEDAEAAMEAVAPARTLLLGYSMGGAVAISAAAAPGVTGVIALAPWIPEQLDLSPLAGRRLVVVHGGLDRPLPGIPGVSPGSSRRGFERAARLGIDGSYTLVRGGLHGIALRGRRGRVLPLPGAVRWARFVGAELHRFESAV
jgi:pimeloyl-ACP methyl ester carboxylesterase